MNVKSYQSDDGPHLPVVEVHWLGTEQIFATGLFVAETKTQKQVLVGTLQMPEERKGNTSYH